MNEQEQSYAKGFNRGYLLTKHEPELVYKITRTLNPTNDYLSGFFSGKEEYELEFSRDQLLKLGNLRERSKNEEQDLER